MGRLPLTSLALLVLGCGLLQAQVDPGECDSCYRNFTFDNSLVIGGHQVSHPDYAARNYPMTLHQIYGHNLVEFTQWLHSPNPPTLRWIVEPAHPWGGFWTVEVDGVPDSSEWGTNHFLEVHEELRRLNLIRNIDLGMKVSLIPNGLDQIYLNARVRENYYTTPETFAPYLLCADVFDDVNRWDTVVVEGDTIITDTLNLSEWRRTYYDTLSGAFHWTRLAPSSSDTVLLGSRPDWIGVGFLEGEAGLYSAAGLPDRTKWMSVGAALRTDITELSLPGIHDTAVIAYIDLFVRNRQGQDSCTCWFLEPWQRVEITKEWFLRRSVGTTKYLAFTGGPTETFYDIDTVVDFDVTHHGYNVWTNVSTPFASGPGTTAAGTDCADWCEVEHAARLALDSSHPLHLLPGTRLGAPIDQGDFHMEVYSTGIVPISLLRTRLAAPHYTDLRDGAYDSLITLEVDGIYADSLVDSLVDRIGVGDEARSLTFRAWGALMGKVQRAMNEHPIGSVRPKKLWVNVAEQFEAFRLYGGDFDSTTFRQIHTPVRQAYTVNGGDPLPLFYANPDSLGQKAWDTVFGAATSDRVHVRINTPGEYAAYNNYVQTDLLGTFGEAFTNHGHSRTIDGTAQLVDVMRFKFRSRFPNLPSSPVWNVVQTHGYMHHGDNATENAKGFDGFTGGRTPTPEEILVMAWGSMASGANGLIFGDMPMTGFTSGPMLPMVDSNFTYENLEYGMYRSHHQKGYNDSIPRWRIDDMWLGMHSRNRAISEVVSDLYHIDSVIGWKNLLYNQEQMSVSDLAQSFTEIPMVGLLEMELAERDSFLYVDSTDEWTFYGTDSVDTRANTFAELTHFTIENDSNARGILIVNRRCWPIDTLTYDSLAQVRMYAVPGIDSAEVSLSGFGAIDVRRPRIVLENNTSVIEDSAVIERISAFSTWRDTVAFGDTVTLEWLLPGRGALYRVEPLPSGISQHSTAYNNAVHSENPSTDTMTHDRLVVYERDSVVYLRSVRPDGAWSRELMLSSPADTVLAGGKRTASNFFPSLAVLRDGTSFPRFVWERDSLGYRSVVTAFIAGAGEVSSTTIDSTLQGIDLSVVRHRLSGADSLVGPPALTPSIVQAVTPNAGAGDGYIISWADHQTGVNVAAMRGIPVSYSLIAAADTAVVYNVSSSQYTPQVGQYPTLATARLFGVVNLTTGTTSGATFPTDTTFTFPSWITGSTADWRNLLMLHLAWQQGNGVDGQGERIYYARVGVDFAENPPGGQPSLWVDNNAEHVSKKIAGCSFEHPSIAADSVRVGVAFEVKDLSTDRRIALRFRDTVGMDPATGLPLKEWETYAYAFGETLRFGRVGTASGAYARPSLTHFPMLDSAALQLQPEGGMTWILQTPLGGRQYRQRLYRYGWFEPREIGDGDHPSLTLVPLVKDDPFEQTSILHRGPVATRTAGENDEGEDVWYYTGQLLNTPGNPLPSLFNVGPGTGSIISGASITGPGQWNECDSGYPIFDFDFDIVFTHGSITHADDDRHGPGDPTTITTEPGLPPTFFGQPGGGATIIDDLSDAAGIVRTSLFMANDQPVSILRGAAASDSIAEVLDGFPFDFLRNSPADIWSVVELVRASDSIVLWRGDTISARGLDTNDIDTVSHEVEVPVGTYADSGEIVFIRVRGFTSPEVVYEVGGGFAFQEEPIGGGTPKAARQREGETGGALLQLSLIPNPVHDGRTTLHVGTELTGRINVDVWDVSGRKVAALPSIDANRPGTYSVELNLEGMRPGSYLVRASATGIERSVTVRLTVVE